MFEIDYRTVQGSILGPLLFALFISPLADITTPTTYADDNYLFGSGNTEKEALKNCIGETEVAMKWFMNRGFKVNKSRTEICVFHQMIQKNEVILDNEKINVLRNIKILGLIFDSKLNWYNQTVSAIEKANKAKQALRIILRYFSTDEMIQLATALFYSRLYYGAKVWLTSALSAPLKKKLLQTSSKMLKICQKDWFAGKSSFLVLSTFLYLAC